MAAETINLQITKDEANVISEALTEYRQKALKQMKMADEKRQPEIYERFRYHLERAALALRKVLEAAAT